MIDKRDSAAAELDQLRKEFKPMCPCGERTHCPEPWEPGCNLGNSEAHVKVATALDTEALRKATAVPEPYEQPRP